MKALVRGLPLPRPLLLLVLHSKLPFKPIGSNLMVRALRGEGRSAAVEWVVVVILFRTHDPPVERFS
jgi:hypothetical protein